MKKFASLVLALVLVLSLCPAAFAADETAAAAKELYDMGLITGMWTKRDGSVDLGLDTHPTRGQSMAILIRILGKTEAAVSKTINTPFNGNRSTGNIGGIAGWTGASTISKCSSSGEITGGNRVGGIAGRLADNGVIEDCTSSATVKALSSGGGKIVGVNDGKNTKVINSK